MNFNYTKLENGNIRIDKYIGSDTNVIIPEYLDGFYVESINKRAFDNCLTLKSVEVKANIKVLQHHAFSACRNLKKIILPQSLEEIERFALGYCRKLEAIEFPHGTSLRCIESDAFFICDSLKSLYIPQTVCEIGPGAFCFCRGLTQITVDKYNQAYDSRDNCNAIIDKDSDTLIVGCKGTVIPEGVKRIGEKAFWGMNGLTSLCIPVSVHAIANNAFDGCYNIERVELKSPYNLTEFEPSELFFIPHDVNLFGISGMKSGKIKEVVLGYNDVPFMLGCQIIAYGIYYNRPDLIQKNYTRYFKHKEFKFFISKAQARGNPEIINKLMCYYNAKYKNKGGLEL